MTELDKAPELMSTRREPSQYPDVVAKLDAFIKASHVESEDWPTPTNK